MSKKLIKNTIIIAGYLLLWQILAMLTSTWLFPGPVDTISALTDGLKSGDFYIRLGVTTLSIMSGFFCGFIAAVILSIIAFRWSVFRDIFRPMIMLTKSVPVACLTILVIIWFGSRALVPVVVGLVVVPVIYTQLVTALLATDKKLLEMAAVYRFSALARIKTIYLDQVKNQLEAAIKLAVGMSFKAGIAAELIGIAKDSIGEELYMSKLYFDTAKLFAWVIVIMLVSFVTERLVVMVYRYLIKQLRKINKCYTKNYNDDKSGVVVKGLIKSFDGVQVIKDYDLEMTQPGIYAIAGRSGAGKSTLLNLMVGIIKPDAGEIRVSRPGYAFQETRLLEKYTVYENMLLVCGGNKETLSKLIETIVPGASGKMAGQLSGGEKKRIELLRAISVNCQVVLLDEPFAGLGNTDQNICTEIINKVSKDKIIIATVHDMAEAYSLNAKMIYQI